MVALLENGDQILNIIMAAPVHYGDLGCYVKFKDVFSSKTCLLSHLV